MSSGDTEPPRVEFLKTPYLRSFAGGRAASVIGAQIVSVTAGWQLYDITHDPWSLGLVGLVELAPALVLMLPAGNAADRYPRRNVAIFSNALIAVAALGLAFASWVNVPIGFIYGFLALIGTARAFASPSVGSIIPQLLPPEMLPGAMPWLSSSYELASITGPAIGGFLIAVTPTLAYAVAGIGQLVFIAVLVTFPALPPKHDQQRAPSDVLAGLAFIKKNPLFLSAITLDLFVVLFGGAVALLPVFARDILHVGPMGLGWLRAAPSLGALTMALLLTRVKPWARPGVVLLFAVVGFALGNIGFALSTNVVVSLVMLYFTGLCDEVSVVVRSTLQQLIVPDHLRGRVSAVNYVFIGFSNELGAFESGAAARLFGPVMGTVGGGMISLIVVGVVAVVWPQLRRIGPLHTIRPLESPPEEPRLQATS
jgi:MFS family permease